MKIITTRMHGIIDYTAGILFISSPWLFGFARGGPETSIPVIIGIMTLLMSFFTDYELGFIKKIHMTLHLRMDIFIGVFFIISPWIFGFYQYVYLPHVIFGVLGIGSGLMTNERPSYKNQPQSRVS
jgi:hypothetical protein